MKLITLDLDGTLLPDDTAFGAVLRAAGKGAEVAASDARYFAGETDLETCFWEQWALVQHLSLADMHRGLRQAAWLPDIGPAVRAWKSDGLRVALLTDQPSVLCDYLGRWGLIDAVCSPVKVHEGVPVSIDARFDKWANLSGRLDAWGIDPADVVHVGNGANDVPVWNHVGAGITAFAQPEIAARATLDAGRPSSLLDVVALQRGGK